LPSPGKIPGPDTLRCLSADSSCELVAAAAAATTAVAATAAAATAATTAVAATATAVAATTATAAAATATATTATAGFSFVYTDHATHPLHILEIIDGFLFIGFVDEFNKGEAAFAASFPV
jgi:hypothetical protein